MAGNYAKTPLSPIEETILGILSDGNPHHVSKLRACLSDGDQSSTHALNQRISELRKILRPQGKDIVLWGKDGYRLMRTLFDEE